MQGIGNETSTFTTITGVKIRLPWDTIGGEKSDIELHVVLSSEKGMPLEVKETGGGAYNVPAGEYLVFILVQKRADGKHTRLGQFKEQH